MDSGSIGRLVDTDSVYSGPPRSPEDTSTLSAPLLIGTLLDRARGPASTGKTFYTVTRAGSLLGTCFENWRRPNKTGSQSKVAGKLPMDSAPDFAADSAVYTKHLHTQVRAFAGSESRGRRQKKNLELLHLLVAIRVLFRLRGGREVFSSAHG